MGLAGETFLIQCLKSTVSDWLENGIRAFNDQDYFEAHECWEDGWRRSRGPTRGFIQGLVQVAVGLHHLSRGNRRGGLRVLRRGLDNLEASPASCSEFDSTRLISNLREYLDGNRSLPIRIRRATPDPTQRG